jgi:Transposase DDE domain group 1
VFLDRPEIAGGEALAGLLRPGNAGSNTAADHITVLGWALESLPPAYRLDPDDPGAQQILVRSDSAGATHAFADACRDAGVGFSFGYGVDTRVQDAVEILNATCGWYPAIDAGGDIRDGAWVAEATHLVDMSSWPAGTRLILRKERPHPGAQLRFTDSDGLRVTAFITDTAHGVVPDARRSTMMNPQCRRVFHGPDSGGLDFAGKPRMDL